MQYRQVIANVWKKDQKALRVVDVGLENTETVSENEVSVSTTVLRFADFFNIEPSGDEQEMTIQVQAGGPINVAVSLGPPATAGAAEGAREAGLGDTLRITGPNDIARMSAVMATGGSAANTRVALTRRSK